MRPGCLSSHGAAGGSQTCASQGTASEAACRARLGLALTLTPAELLPQPLSEVQSVLLT